MGTDEVDECGEVFDFSEGLVEYCFMNENIISGDKVTED